MNELDSFAPSAPPPSPAVAVKPFQISSPSSPSTFSFSETPSPSSPSKKRLRPVEIEAMDTDSPSEETKKTKRVRSEKKSLVPSLLDSLEPFTFLLTEKPSSIAFGYSRLIQWLDGAVNGDFSPSDRPFALHLSARLPKKARTRWQTLTQLLNTASAEQLSGYWDLSLIVHNLITLLPEEEWQENEKKYLVLHSRLWWVKASQKWFSQSTCTTTEDYINTGMSALIMECWYRFVWAHHTLRVHSYLLQNATDNDMKPSLFDSDQVFNLDNLGEGEESDMEDDDMDDSMEEDDSGDSSGESVLTPLKAKNSSPSSSSTVLSPPAFHEVGMEGAGSEAEGEMDVDEAVNNEYVFKEELGVGDGEYGEEFTDIPPVVSLFFSQASISAAIEEIESVLLGREGDWNITAVIAMFVKLVVLRDRDMKVAIPLSKARVERLVKKMYQEKAVPFLEAVGIVISRDDDIYRWRLHEEFHEFYLHHVAIVGFRHLTTEGEVAHSREFLQLFPRLFMLSDSRTATSVSLVCSRLHRLLKDQGKLTTELDELITLLDELLDERRSFSNSSMSMETDASSSSSSSSISSSILDTIRRSRANRLKDIDMAIKHIQTVLHQHTQQADEVPDKDGATAAALKAAEKAVAQKVEEALDDVVALMGGQSI